MSLIKLTLPGGEIPVDGKQVTFKAPCNCTSVTGLSIDGEEYTIVDTMGVDVTGLEGIFTSGSLVNVTLSVADKKAYIHRNASYHTHSAGDMISGVLPIERGGTGVSSDAALQELVGSAQASFLAFLENNAATIDAAFGKGVEDYVRGVGLAIAMYAIYKGTDSTFPNLKKVNNLVNLPYAATTDILYYSNSRSLIDANAYAADKVWTAYLAHVLGGTDPTRITKFLETYVNVTRDSANGYAKLKSHMQILTGSGTYTVPSDCKALLVIAIGGGGSGGAAIYYENDDDLNFAAGTGGGSGYIVQQMLEVTPGQQISYSVGAGGAAQKIDLTVGGSYTGKKAGKAGGATTFGTITANGGGAGKCANGTTSSAIAGLTGGAGGAAGGSVVASVNTSGSSSTVNTIAAESFTQRGYALNVGAGSDSAHPSYDNYISCGGGGGIYPDTGVKGGDSFLGSSLTTLAASGGTGYGAGGAGAAYCRKSGYADTDCISGAGAPGAIFIFH